MVGTMHPAPSLSEAPPKGSPRPYDPLSGQRRIHALPAGPRSPQQSLRSSLFDGFSPDEGTGREQSRQSRSPSTSSRKDTLCSTSTNATTVTNASQPPSNETAAASQSLATSPKTTPSQNVFSVNDGSDASQNRQKRRRTGPLNPEQRVKAALIRKHGACDTCHKRRVACDPSHHNLTWDDLRSRYGATSPNRQDSVPVSPRGWNPTNARPKRNSEDMEMDLEQSPSPRSEQTTVKGRTPLPRGPRLTGPQAALPSLNSPERPRPDLPGLAPRTYTIPDCGRYSAVEALLLFWTDDRHSELRAVVDGLQQVLSEQYNSACVVQSIPSSATPAHLYRWLSDQIRNFARHNDQRDVLKIVYYNGHAYLNRNRDMVLASSPRPNEATEIRWKPIQADLEESSTDTLIIMDCPYFGDKLSSSRGILEVLASNTYDDYVRCPIPRCAFTKALTEKLQTHASQGSPRTPLCATDLHAHLMSEYPKIIRDTRSDDEALQNFPSPSHVLVRARDTMAASIELIPRRRGSSPPRSLEPGRQLNISLRIGGDADLETLVDFFRLKPDAVRQVQIEDRTPLSALN